MTSVREFEADLLNNDGSCRDINFESPTWQGATDLVRWFCENYELRSATTAQGTDITTVLARRENYELFGPLAEGSIHLVGENQKLLITWLQVFIGNGDIETPFVELTLFPTDLSKTVSWSTFIRLVDEIQQILKSKRYFVRYENASWRFGDPDFGSGVIFTSGN